MDTMDKLVTVGQLERLKDSLGGGSSPETVTVLMRGPSGSISDQNKISATYLSGGSVESEFLSALDTPFFIDALTPAVLSSPDSYWFRMNVDGDGIAFPHEGYSTKFLFVAYGPTTVTTEYGGA